MGEVNTTGKKRGFADAKIFGVSLVLILLIIGIAALVDIPMALLHSADMSVSKAALQSQQETQKELQKIRTLLEVTPTVTPEVTVTPTPSKALQRSTKPASSSAR